MPAVEEQRAPADVQAIFRQISEQLGYERLPNLWRVLASSPPLLASIWRLTRGVLLSGELPRPLKELIVFAIAVRRGCRYCARLHALRILELGVSEEVLVQIHAGGKEIELPGAERTLLRFAQRFAVAPKSLTAADFARLDEEGFGRREVAEVVAVATLAVSLTSLAVGLRVEPDAFVNERLPGWLSS